MKYLYAFLALPFMLIAIPLGFIWRALDVGFVFGCSVVEKIADTSKP